MKINNGTVCIGIINKHDFETINCNDYFKQLMVSNLFCLPDPKPNIESILEVITECKITRSKIIRTPHGRKIIFHGIIIIKIIYEAKNPEQSVHSTHFTQHFYNFINLEDEYNHCDCHNHGKDLCDDFRIDCFIEDIEPALTDVRKLELSILILIAIKLCKK